MPRITEPVHDIFAVKSGIYLLEIIASRDFFVGIKKFREITFPAGYYYYAGSAQKNFASRIKRHLKHEKVIHWHIDHLTTISSNEISSIYYVANAERDLEVELAKSLISEFGCEVIVEKFGSSDTPESITHLVYRKSPLSPDTLREHYNSVQVYSHEAF